MSRTNESATCAMTRELRKRERRNPAIEHSSFKAGTSCGFDDCSAGIRLKRIPVAIERSEGKDQHAPIDAQIEDERDIDRQFECGDEVIDPCGEQKPDAHRR